MGPDIPGQLPAAVIRSYQRLYESLNDEQQQMLEQRDYFEFRSSRGRAWRIYCNSGYMGNVYCLTTGQLYCCHIGSSVRDWSGDTSWPYYDHFLAQALLIRTNEDAFLRLAFFA